MVVEISDDTKLKVESLSKARTLIEKATGKKTKAKFVDEMGGGIGPVLKNFYQIYIPPYDTNKGRVGLYFGKYKRLYTQKRIKKKIEKFLKR